MTTREMGLPAQWTRAIERAKAEGVYVVNAHTEDDRTDAVVISPKSGTTYAVMIEASPAGVMTGCDCKGAEDGRNCKHVAKLLLVAGVLH
jgi:hypothetical protein